MTNKKIVLTIQRQNKNITGILSEEMMKVVCQQTGLSADEVMSNIEWLTRLGIIQKQEAIIH